MSTPVHDPAYRAHEVHKKGPDCYLSIRKRLLNEAERRHPGARMEWHGGILYFMGGAKPLEVPGVQHVPKPGRQAVGYEVAQVSPPQTAKEPTHRTSYTGRVAVFNNW